MKIKEAWTGVMFEQQCVWSREVLARVPELMHGTKRERPFTMTKMLPISNDDTNAFRLDDKPPNPRIAPGENVQFDCTIQGGPMLFGRLIVSQQVGISSAGKAVVAVIASWRVDDVTLDGSSVDLTDGCVDPMRTARRVTMRATNIGKDPAYFYGAWELHDIELSTEQNGDPDMDNALDREIRRKDK